MGRDDRRRRCRGRVRDSRLVRGPRARANATRDSETSPRMASATPRRRYAYVLLLTDRYPNADPNALGPEWELPPHPVRLALDDDQRRSRLTVLFRLLLALPHFVWLALWTVAAFLAAFVNGLVALVRGRSATPVAPLPERICPLHRTCQCLRLPRREPVPGLRGRAGLSGRRRDRRGRAPEPLGDPVQARSSRSRRS